MLADYCVKLEQTMGNMTLVMTDVRAESEQDACEIARQHTATPHHWRVVTVWEMS